MDSETHLHPFAVVTIENTKLADAPVLFFVYFHKAFRTQITELRRFATDAAAAGSFSWEQAGELRRKFEFLKLVYKYHSAAEDEVIFLALDARMKNIVSSYAFEHAGTDDLFSSVFHWLHVLEEELGSVSDVLREVILCIGTIQSSICQHMLKEERQVFPLLIEKFSFREQASLVWEFICSVPVMVLKDFLPWMMYCLSKEERKDVVKCMKNVVPSEDSLQQVISSWLIDNSQSTCGASTKIKKWVQYEDVSKNKNSSRTHESRGCFQWFWRWSKKALSITNVDQILIHGVQLYQNAVEKDLRDIHEGLRQEKSSTLVLDLDVLVARLNFLVDVLVSYCNASNKFFHPVLDEIASSSANTFNTDVCLENFQRFLYKSDDVKMRTEGFLLKLQEELESLILQVTKLFSVQRAEVFPIINKNCNHEMQKQLLYTSIHALPLGLLKCFIPWFSGHLSEKEYQFILHFLTFEDSSPQNSFPRLLLQWLPFCYLSKTFSECFLKQLFAMLCFSKRNKSSTFFMLPGAGDMYKTPYSSRMLFSGNVKSRPVDMDDDPFTMDRKPIDLIFFFHKAMKADLDYLVSGSARLASDSSFLQEFQQRFHLIKLFYQMHSNAEDEIAFPALEAKENQQNITHSFSIDHELETKHFDKVSLILNEMSEQEMKYDRLCLSLQEICRSMHKILSEHFKHEETELWGLFRDCFTIEEQEKIIGSMLGRISGEILKDMIPWLMDSLTSDEQHAAMSLWLQTTRNTMFVDWLREWYNGHIMQEQAGESNKDSDHSPRINSHNQEPVSRSIETVPGQHPSYRDTHSSVFGCKHYKRNCKLLAPCCDQLFTCIHCHDEEADHLVDRKHIEKMMCMKCLFIQPIGENCSNTLCKSSMGKYFCKICKLFDDERSIYHCPYCNLCRVGRGLGIDYFHCMKCNVCLSRSLKDHVCREKWLEVDCPICHEYMFTSRTVVKPLPCGHSMQALFVS